jgi:large subunit ribosomal protein L22
MPVAKVRYLRVSPPKIRQVLGLIRGREVDDARERLRFCERDAAEPVLKLLDSAIANAENNDHLPPDELYIDAAWCDEGPTLKRWRPRARGRATRIRKRTSHITIVVERFSDDELQRRRRIDELKGGVTAAHRPSRIRRVMESLEDTVEPDDTHAHHEHDHVVEPSAEKVVEKPKRRRRNQGASDEDGIVQIDDLADLGSEEEED